MVFWFKKLILLIGLAFWSYSATIKAQTISFDEHEVRKVEDVVQGFKKVGFTSQLIDQPFYENFSEEHSLLQRNLQKRKKRENFTLGDTNLFYVRNVIEGDSWGEVKATLGYSDVKINLWFETSSFDTLANTKKFSRIISGFDSLLHKSTSEYSADANKGVLEILNEYVGNFPDVDGDNALDVLILDIKDNFLETGSYVAGFFDPVNLTEHDYSNKRDLIYLDIYPTLLYQEEVHVERAVATLVHESQHLIHAGYEGEKPELVFVNEGFSEATEILCGFKPRSVAGFQKAPLRGLTYWNHKNPIPDYSRASLWTHYLIEQLGPLSLKEFVQNPEVGINGYKRVIEKLSTLTFDQVFQNWGLATLINDNSIHPEFGYRHESRKGRILNTELSINELPSIFEEPLPSYVNMPIYFPLIEELELEAGSFSVNSIWLSAIKEYPNRSQKEVSVYNTSSFEAEAKKEEYGSIRVLVSNYKPDSLNFSFKVEGRSSGTKLEESYGDGKPDIFYRNASYLSLNNSHKKLAVLIPPEESSYWLQEFEIWTLFDSELEGGSLDGSTERDFTIDIFTVQNATPNKRLVPSKVFDVQREQGKLEGEVFRLSDFYSSLSNIKDTVMLVISNDDDDQNYLALGLDHGNVDATLFSNQPSSVIGWEKLSEKYFGDTSLKNWNMAIGVSKVLSEVKERVTSSINDITYSFNKVSVIANPPFAYDSSSVSMIAKMPDGNFKKGELTSTNGDGVIFNFPVISDGEYTFINRFESPEGKITYRDERQWQIDVPNGFRISNNYPNPFNPSTTIPFLLLERASIEWKVFDVTGRLIQSIPAKIFNSGEHTQIIDLQNQASGLYLVRAKLHRQRSNSTKYITQKIMLIK